MHTETISTYYLNVLVTTGLIFLHFAFSKLFDVTDKDQAKFFRLLTAAWLINLFYLLFLGIAGHPPPEGELLKHIIVRSLNTASYCIFLLSSRWLLSSSHPRILSYSVIFTVSSIGLGLSLAALRFPAIALPLLALSVLLGVIALTCIGVNYHLFFTTAHHFFSKPMRFSIVYSMYGYAALQFAVFLVPPYSNYFFSRFPNFENSLFFLGMALKLVHIAGLSSLGAAVFAEYERKLRLVSQARLSVNIADQFAHELQTPAAELRVRISGLADSTEPSSLDQNESRVVMNLLEQVTTLLTVFDKFQRDQRLDANGNTDRAMCNLNTIADSVIIALKITSRPQCRIDKEYVTGPVVNAVESELAQIVRNLVKNAIEACTAGATKKVGIVSVQTALNHDKGLAQLIVTDNGTGVDTTLFDRIFEDGFTTKGGHGRGHGLYIARTLARKADGEIFVENISLNSNVSGARFRLDLPLATKPPPTKSEDEKNRRRR